MINDKTMSNELPNALLVAIYFWMVAFLNTNEEDFLIRIIGGRTGMIINFVISIEILKNRS